MTEAIEKTEQDQNIEVFDYLHPLGVLTMVFDHTAKELVMVSFTPNEDIRHEEVKSVDWFFKGGENTGWGTGQNGWEWKLKGFRRKCKTVRSST